MRKSALMAALLLLAAALPASAQLPTKHVLTLDAAKRMAAAAEDVARQNGWNVIIAIVDDAGRLVYLQRMDDVQPASLEIAQRKARTAAAYRRPTKVLADWLADGRNVVLALPDVIALEGGLPLVVDGNVIGAIGVSGVTAQQDGIIAQAAVDALAALAGGESG